MSAGRQEGRRADPRQGDGGVPVSRAPARLTSLELARETTGDQTRVDVIARESIDEAIPAASASVLYRVAQEAICNACRHPAAEQIEILASADADNARFEITDDGIGFDP
ncbi:MAG: hypothetical protein M3Y05_09000 [Gemmatimonadota bacterium]|nr:hypothetical protein [Gemmatimonadota bacterium]